MAGSWQTDIEGQYRSGEGCSAEGVVVGGGALLLSRMVGVGNISACGGGWVGPGSVLALRYLGAGVDVWR